MLRGQIVASSVSYDDTDRRADSCGFGEVRLSTYRFAEVRIRSVLVGVHFSFTSLHALLPGIRDEKPQSQNAYRQDSAVHSRSQDLILSMTSLSITSPL